MLTSPPRAFPAVGLQMTATMTAFLGQAGVGHLGDPPCQMQGFFLDLIFMTELFTSPHVAHSRADRYAERKRWKK